MKKSIFSYFSYLVLLLLAVGTLSSCGETDGTDPAPTITINPTSATIDVGQQADFTYTVVASKNLEEIRIISRNVTQQTVVDFTNNDSHNGTFSFIGGIDDAGTTVTITVEAVDTDGNRSSSSVDIAVNDAPDPIAIKTYPAILLGAQDNASTGSFLDASEGNVYKIADAKANSALVDMAYLQGSSSNGQGAVIGSLRDASVEQVFSTETGWATRNDTRFRNTSLTTANFDAIIDGSELTAAYAAGSEPNIGTTGDPREGATSRVNQLAANTVFAFRTADGKDGLVKVVSIDAGTTGSIRLEVKVVE
ncbi:hypothetical protein [Bernardetia sp.]|uniref:hypothetical protein n=1 Tax=Bernardetia sp. TaxID=1937974 RepID=UPI0025BD90BC|nr:hypothetical protein [Bernardetia sp.]